MRARQVVDRTDPRAGSPGKPVHSSDRTVPRAVVSILAALSTLVIGITLAAGGDASGGGFTITFLVAAPAIAMAVLTRSLDPFARCVLALAAVVVVNTLVAEAMLASDTWSISGGVATVGVISAALWLAAWASSTSRGGSGDSRRELVAQQENDRRNGMS